MRETALKWTGPTIKIKNFGQISSGAIKIKPLTIFIGPNNSGKSYGAILINSIFRSFPEESYRIYSKFYHENFFMLYFFGEQNITFFEKRKATQLPDIINRLLEGIKIEREVEEIEKNIKNQNKKEFEIPESLLIKIYKRYLEELYEQTLKDEIEKSFNCKIGKLIRIGSRKFTLEIKFNSDNVTLKGSKKDLKIIDFSIGNLKIMVKKSPRVFLKYPNILKGIKPKQHPRKKGTYTISIPQHIKEGEEKLILAILIYHIKEICYKSIYNIGVGASHFLPAARSGILQGHKALMAGLIEQSSRVFIEGIQIPKFSGTVSDFMKAIIKMSQMEKGVFYRLAEELERELIHGEVKYESLENTLYPEIIYRFRETNIPLYRTSSTVSELAPLILYLKYLIKKGDMLIIEEPEAHLHPKNQRILAKYIVKLIRNKVNMIITTHSDYFLRQLNNFIKISGLPAEKRQEYGYEKDLFLDPTEVSAYIFRLDREGNKSKIKSVKITTEDGILQDEFLKIDEALYEETIKIERGFLEYG